MSLARQRSPFYYWIPAILCIVVIGMVSSDRFSSGHTGSWLYPLFHRLMPNLSPAAWDSLHIVLRKLGHWAGYLILACAIYRGFRGARGRIWRPRWAFWTLGLVLLVAIGDELHQSFTATRTGSPWDSALDFFGGCCGMVLERCLSQKAALCAENGAKRDGIRYSE